MASPSDNSHPAAPDEPPALQALEEEPVLPESRVRDESEMEITPIIDMTFLLLIFFVVCSKLDPTSGVTLPTARHGNALAVDNAVVFTISAGAEEAQIYRGEGVINSNLVTGATPAEKEAQVVAYIEEQIADRPNVTDVLILAEAGVKHRDVAVVMKAVGMVETEGNQLHVAVMEKP